MSHTPTFKIPINRIVGKTSFLNRGLGYDISNSGLSTVFDNDIDDTYKVYSIVTV